MTMGAYLQATSQLYWISALVAALIDLGLAALLVWQIKPARFRQLQWPLLDLKPVPARPADGSWIMFREVLTTSRKGASHDC